MSVCIWVIFGAVRMPATTSSPWALVRYSPKSDLLARVRVARERDAGAGVVAHVAEDHRHDVDGRAEVVGDLLVLAVVLGALAEPRGEDGLDREVELLERILGKSRPVSALTMRLESVSVPQGGGVELGVLLRRLGAPWPLRGRGRTARPDVHDDPPEHLDEAPIGVPAEALVAGQPDQALERAFVVNGVSGFT